MSDPPTPARKPHPLTERISADSDEFVIHLVFVAVGIAAGSPNVAVWLIAWVSYVNLWSMYFWVAAWVRYMRERRRAEVENEDD